MSLWSTRPAPVCGAATGRSASGRDGGETVTAWDLARAAGTIPYEILCGIGPRVERVHTEGRG